MIALTRRYRFPAAHVLRRPEWSQADNERVYGACANPNGHGHDYALEVTVAGEPDAASGQLVDPAALDAVVAEAVLARLSHRLLNEDPLFSDAVPTAENIAIAAHRLLDGPVAQRTGARLRAVRVRETRNNTFDYGDVR